MMVCKECKHRIAQHDVNVYESGYYEVRCFHNSYMRGRKRIYECSCEDHLHIKVTWDA